MISFNIGTRTSSNFTFTCQAHRKDFTSKIRYRIACYWCIGDKVNATARNTRPARACVPSAF